MPSSTAATPPWAATTPARLVLFVEGLGRHELTLEMVARLDTTAARQVLSFRLPRPPAAKLRLTAPGDVEIKEGADVVSRCGRPVGQSDAIRASAPPGRHHAGDDAEQPFPAAQRLVMARSVLVDEVTAAYEKLHATVSLEILHRAVDQFRFVVPEGFEITEVASPLLAYWDVRQEGGRTAAGRQAPRADHGHGGAADRGDSRPGPAGGLARAAAGTAGRGRQRDRAGPAGRGSPEGRIVPDRGADPHRRFRAWQSMGQRARNCARWRRGMPRRAIMR